MEEMSLRNAVGLIFFAGILPAQIAEHPISSLPYTPSLDIPSMDRSVETIIRDNKRKIKPGDVYVINAPYNGGTHLPDITVCTPVFDEAGACVGIVSGGDVRGAGDGSVFVRPAALLRSSAPR